MDVFFFSTFGKAFIPKKARPHLRSFFEKTGSDEVPYHVFGILFWIAVLVSYLLYITQIYPSLIGKDPVLFFFLTFLVWVGSMFFTICLIGGFAYLYLTMKIYHRTKEMEEKLPDYLVLVSTSIRGGYSFEAALWNAIKPEFGVLAKEIGLVSKRVMTGSDVVEALEDFVQKYESPIIRRAFNLIIGELEAGGKIVIVIERVIDNLKKTKNLKQEMAASTLTYMIFISALVMFIMPLLFALSFVLFTIVSGFIGNVASSVSASSATPFHINKPSVDPDDFKIFTLLTITIIASCSAMIISIIEKGDMKGGLKYVPIFVVTSITVYWIFLQLFLFIFGGIVPTAGP